MLIDPYVCKTSIPGSIPGGASNIDRRGPLRPASAPPTSAADSYGGLRAQ